MGHSGLKEKHWSTVGDRGVHTICEEKSILWYRTKATQEHIGVQKPKLPRAILRRKRAEWVRVDQGGVQKGAEEHSVEGHSKATPLVELFLCCCLLMLMAVCRWKEDDKVGTREIESEAFSELWSQREIFKSLKLMDSHIESFISPPLPHIPHPTTM